MCKFTLFGCCCRCNFADAKPRKLFRLESAQQIPADVTFIDTRHEFPSSSVHLVDVEAGLPCPLSRRHNRIFHASLPRSSLFFFIFFRRILLSKPVIFVDEHALHMRTRMTLRLMASHTGHPLNPSILARNSFPCFQVVKSR